MAPADDGRGVAIDRAATERRADLAIPDAPTEPAPTLAARIREKIAKYRYAAPAIAPTMISNNAIDTATQFCAIEESSASPIHTAEANQTLSTVNPLWPPAGAAAPTRLVSQVR